MRLDMAMTTVAGFAVLALGAGTLGAQQPRPLSSPEEAARQAEIEAALKAEQELEKSLAQIRTRRRELQQSGQPRSGGDIPDLADVGSRIVNGVATVEFPSVGALLTGPSPDAARAWCSGTLVGCRTFLTANHCVARDRTPGAYQVFFQHAGFVAVEAISPPHDEYHFPHADVAVLKLSRAVAGLPVTAVNRSLVVREKTPGTLVGFGRTGGLAQDAGVKRRGTVLTAPCDRRETSLLCWDFDDPVALPGVSSNTCNTDSGGPLFVRAAPGTPARLLAGLTSGGTREDCLGGDHSYDVDVRQFGDWIAGKADGDLGTTACGARPLVEERAVRVLSGGRSLRLGEIQDYRFRVPEGTETLVVALNGTDNAGTNLNLFVRRGAAATASARDCAQDGDGNFGACEFPDPAAGDWFLRVDQQGQGAAEFQVVVTMFPRSPLSPSPGPSGPPGPR